MRILYALVAIIAIIGCTSTARDCLPSDEESRDACHSDLKRLTFFTVAQVSLSAHRQRILHQSINQLMS
jgi:hypothetical protein